jgi:hypothetical protein
MDGQKSKSAPTGILRPGMSLTLVLLPQELRNSFIGWLRIIALIGMESFEVDEDETLGMGRSAKGSLRGRWRDLS